ncbi:acyl-ACP--UDP-N-acetylglucosamine O-acyltransferase [Enterovirga rhinocerotis]|uniref:Acyl-[acyl-carrier-protein]--UDP-N-acetylglucosamine O-acyltransferase n=1 Tax=Enterovirga rhinocerotis TaxID=1339210 RepID=A0A4R7C9Y1_9HYPH|nr:acyl-ACP--UDP-N-acetylglucosamine O-acyltransferase [Enterovirga rhinocerotis]TDR93587.1 acyl-[acyl-carrier-protein]--UDP-N-acetylglucosamine O-acyltransferase [Enterovirga rhinocerotis]
MSAALEQAAAPADIHSSAIVDPRARIGAGVKIGPFCTVGPDVEVGDGCELLSHVVLAGHTTIGPRCRIFPFASIGQAPQDLRYKGEPTTLSIGADCIIREGVTVNTGTANGKGKTTVGDRCFLLSHSHVAHDCVVGSNVILTNNTMLAGHCQIGDYAILGGGVGIHQFVRIGPHAFIGGLSAVENDVIPYGMVIGNRAYLHGLNIIGLRRRGFSREQIHDLRRAYRLLFAAEGTLTERVEDVAEEFASHPTVQEILDFIRLGGERSICVPRETPAGA